MYHLETGEVEFMGPSPQQSVLLNSPTGLPPSMTREGGRRSGYGPATAGEHGVRTTVDAAVSAEACTKKFRYRWFVGTSKRFLLKMFVSHISMAM